MATSSTTETLAAWGAITGTIGSLSGAAACINLLRDRPRLSLSAVVHYVGSTDNRELRCTVVNAGRQPTTIMDAGVAVDVERFGRWPLRRLLPTAIVHSPEDGRLPARLEPGEPFTWIAVLDASDRGTASSQSVFVQDSSGRTLWGYSRQGLTRRLRDRITHF